MIFHARVASKPLSDFVELLWLYEGYRQPHKKERLLPTGTTELVFDLREDLGSDTCGSVLSGPHSEYFELDTSCETSVVGIHFKPGGAFPFFKMPANEFRNTNVSLELLWGSRARSVRDRLLAAVTSEEKFRILEETLLAEAARPLIHTPAVAFALKKFYRVPTVTTVSELSDEIGFSTRHFIQIFSAEVGLTPKLYCRVRRFQEVLKSVHRRTDIDWADVAINCGYFDQPHFIHDFKAFSRINPSTYSIARTE